jgi:hypothetical protein
MFEDSTFASTGKIRMRSRAGFFAAFFFDSVTVLALYLIPLLYPHVLPRVFTSDECAHGSHGGAQTASTHNCGSCSTRRIESQSLPGTEADSEGHLLRR